MSYSKSCCLFAVILVLLAPPLQAGTRMIFPRIAFQKDRFFGIAVANPTSSQADVTLKAWTTDGKAFSGTGVTNPATRTIKPGSQYVKLATEIFFPGGVPAQFDGSTPTRVWVEATSTTDGLTGFFLEGNSALNFMDGADLSGSGTDLIIPIVENTSGTVTEISLVNPDAASAANVSITFYKEDGSTVATKATTVPPSGTLQGPLSDSFADVDYSQVHGLRIHSDHPVSCYASIFQPDMKSLITIAAQSTTLPSKTLYFPQLAEGAGWSTAVGVQNMTGSDILVTLTAYDSDGNIFAPPVVKQNPVTQTIKGWGLLHAKLADPNLQNWFGFTADSLHQGWVKVETSVPSINGFVEYSDQNSRALVPAQLTSYTKAIFSYQVQSLGYYTGLAILNPGSAAATVEISSLKGDATSYGKTQLVLKPGQRISKLIYELIPQSQNASDGSVFVKSDSATVATQLFASALSLANIAPQQVTTDWDPGAAVAKLALTPQLSVVETGKTKTYTVSGVTGGTSVAWSVDTGAGSITSTGTNSASYQAPANKPDHHNLTILAAADTRTAGATVDVVQREELIQGLTLITAVAYLENLQRFFVAEQQVLASAPSDRYAASSSNTKISQVSPGTSTTTLVKTISGDTVSKMLPFSNAGKDYLILAGYDTGSIYRLDVSNGNLATVKTGLNKPSSLAFDPATGNLLVAESGASQISVVQLSELTAASGPDSGFRAGIPWPRKLAVLSVVSPQGIAVDKCSGTIYATLADGTLQEYKGSSKRTVVSGLNRPKQIQVIYRDGMSCSDGLTLAVVEASQITLVYVASGRTDSMVSAVQNVQDITFFPHNNPYTKGGEASIGLAEGPPGTGASRISQVGVGDIYQSDAPTPVASSNRQGDSSVLYVDPAGDTFDTARSKSSGNSVPDILSVDSYAISGYQVIALTFSFPVAPYTDKLPNSIDVSIWVDTQSGGYLADLSPYQGLGQSGNFSIRYDISLYDGTWFDSAVPNSSGTKIPVSYLGPTVSIMIPNSLLPNPEKATIVVLVGNMTELTDVAPNAGAISLVTAKSAGQVEKN